MAKTRLSQEEWRRVEEVYHEALEHRPESRAAFVTAACGVDSSLRREVESLLAADGADALVDQPAMDIAGQGSAVSNVLAAAFSTAISLIRPRPAVCRITARGKWHSLPQA